MSFLFGTKAPKPIRITPALTASTDDDKFTMIDPPTGPVVHSDQEISDLEEVPAHSVSVLRQRRVRGHRDQDIEEVLAHSVSVPRARAQSPLQSSRFRFPPPLPPPLLTRSLQRVPSNDSMPGLISMYNSSDDEVSVDELDESDSSEDEKYIDKVFAKPFVLVKPSPETLENLINGLYDITFDNGDRYIGFVKNCRQNGYGKYMFSGSTGHPDFQEGRFENDKLVTGIYDMEDSVMEGTFKVDEDGNECLEGPECSIVYSSGIQYRGAVDMDEPYADGQYNIPDNTCVEFEGRTGTLSHQIDRFYLTFEEGSIAQVSSEDFDCVNLCFLDDSSVRIDFQDDCVFEGISTCNEDGDQADFSFHRDGVDYFKWDHFQTMMYLMSVVPDHPVPFFDMVQKHKLNLRQLSKCKPSHWKMLKLDKIHTLQLKDMIDTLWDPQTQDVGTQTQKNQHVQFG
jgi:hypothetical protein